MKCGNRLCVYQKNNECTNENEVEIDWHGLCKNVIPVKITHRELDGYKFYTKMVYERNEEHYFDKEIGQLVLKEEFLSQYDKDLDF